MVTRKRIAAIFSALVQILMLDLCSGEAFLQGDKIVIAGKDNTLFSVARDIADREIFNFDPEENLALANRNLFIKGTLRIGSEEAPESFPPRPQVLEMNISRCGAVRIEVASSPGEVGELYLRRAKLTTLHETDDKCSDPNLLIVRGKLIARDSEISGNIECTVSPGASVELLGTTISYTQDSALSCGLREAQQLNIRDSAFIDSANYGIRISSCPDGLEVCGSIFRGLAADVFNASGGELILTDCDFNTVKFGALPGRVVRKWSVKIEVPSGGLHVVASSARGNPRREVVRGVSDENGVCRLALTEYVAFPPRAQEFREGVNNATPHDIFVYDRDGKTLLYKMENFHVFTKGQTVRFQ